MNIRSGIERFHTKICTLKNLKDEMSNNFSMWRKIEEEVLKKFLNREENGRHRKLLLIELTHSEPPRSIKTASLTEHFRTENNEKTAILRP